jgi:Bacterial TniB protein
MTSASRQLRRRVESSELQHLEFANHHATFKKRIDDTLNGFAPRICWLIGPSRVGKTMLGKALARLYPAYRVNGRRTVPVLRVPLPPGVSPKLLPLSVLQALGVPLPQRGLASGVMVNRMSEQLRLAGTRVLIFEEASHLVEPGSKVPPRAAADWFKAVHDELDITLLLLGVPRLKRLFEANEQLRLRATACTEFRPYRWYDEVERRAFATCVLTYARLFDEAGWPINMTREQLIGHCYLLSGGLIGIVAVFMQDLAALTEDIPAGPITLEHCQRVANTIEAAGHPSHPAFVNDQITPIEFDQAHGYVLESNAMGVRRSVV